MSSTASCDQAFRGFAQPADTLSGTPHAGALLGWSSCQHIAAAWLHPTQHCGSTLNTTALHGIIFQTPSDESRSSILCDTQCTCRTPKRGVLVIHSSIHSIIQTQWRCHNSLCKTRQSLDLNTNKCGYWQVAEQWPSTQPVGAQSCPANTEAVLAGQQLQPCTQYGSSAPSQPRLRLICTSSWHIKPEACLCVP
jgi:hypothetical protein